ncbi:fluoride efflux transporter FluC [Blastococcus goldschmidtiae]|uniref:Fluoride-specific ion channel FluC n=1 Tax=Blastococcus goldschmidtiae TaxID=3075546 RepID=A0ABU2K295_9ACTN|nr:CrcB family protein [Blastococcus sp. DSM 46792]MDT0274471.1 CrcB family protein [Blastococcus sp. DSM 46792]
MTPLLVVLGAMAGAPLRLLAERLAVAGRGPGSVVGTAVVNVGGSALLGLLVGLAGIPGWVLALIGVGFCGTLTTFSTLGADVVRLGEQRRPGRAAAYLGGTLVLGIGAAAAAYGAAGLL